MQRLNHIDFKVLGASLSEVATDVIQTTHHDVISRWFHSNQEVDLYIWLDLQQNIIKQQVSFLGQIVEWNALDGVKTGLVVIDETDEKRSAAKPSEVIRFDRQSQAQSLAQACELIECMGALKESEKAQLLKNFREPTSLREMSSGAQEKEWLSRYGHLTGHSLPKTKSEEPLWATLKRKLLAFFKMDI